MLNTHTQTPAPAQILTANVCARLLMRVYVFIACVSILTEFPSHSMPSRPAHTQLACVARSVASRTGGQTHLLRPRPPHTTPGTPTHRGKRAASSSSSSFSTTVGKYPALSHSNRDSAMIVLTTHAEILFRVNSYAFRHVRERART